LPLHELGGELQRFLDGRPILARPVGSFERAWRLCRRNPLVASLAALFAVSLVAVSVTTSVAATITPQHLLHNRNAIFAGGIRPHFYCLPILKREADRVALEKKLMQLVSTATGGKVYDVEETRKVLVGLHVTDAEYAVIARHIATVLTKYKVKIYPVSGLPGDQNQAIGTFYVRIGGDLCAYDLPGGSFSAKFNFATGAHFTMLPPSPTAGQSWTLDGTFELDILEATGIYQPFVGGHIHMVDILKFRAGDGTQLEDCFCHIHPKLVAP
jgi:hypothetical protein